MNGYNGITVPDFGFPPQPIKEFSQYGLAGGYRDNVGPRELQPDEATDLVDVRFDGHSLKKEYGWDNLGTDAAFVSPISGMGDYYNGNASKPWRAGFTKDGSFNWRLKLQYWNGSWNNVTDLVGALTLADNVVSIQGVSMYDKLVLAFGDGLAMWDGGAALASLSASAPVARYIAPFGTRLLAFQVGNDPQTVSWPVSGDITNWSGDGSGNVILADVRSDVVDALMGGVQTNASTFALFRNRSIWRAFLTGNVAQAIGFQPWIDGLGTNAPFSIQSTPLGVAFLATDNIVYILDGGGGLLPIGAPIQKTISGYTNANSEAVSAYNYLTGEYWIGFPSTDVAWVLDLARYQREQKIVWRKISIPVDLFANPTTGLGLGVTKTSAGIWFSGALTSFDISSSYTTKNGTSFTGTWRSRPLNSKPTLNTLSMLSLYYNSPSSTSITVKISGNGGQTWDETQTVNLAATTGKDAIVNVAFNTTGTDLRFQIEFPNTVACRITGYRPVLVERGAVEYE